MPGTITGGGFYSWTSVTAADCGNGKGLRAGKGTGGGSGVNGNDGQTIFTFPASDTASATSMTYRYSTPGTASYTFEIIVNGVPVKSYDTTLAADCVQDCISLQGGDTVAVRCASSGSQRLTCEIDEIQFYLSARRMLLGDDIDNEKVSSTSESSPKPATPTPETPQPVSPRSPPTYPFSASSRLVCDSEPSKKEMQDGEICSGDLDEDGKFNCCENKDSYSCDTCKGCFGWGQLLNGLDEMGRTW